MGFPSNSMHAPLWAGCSVAGVPLLMCWLWLAGQLRATTLARVPRLFPFWSYLYMPYQNLTYPAISLMYNFSVSSYYMINNKNTLSLSSRIKFRIKVNIFLLPASPPFLSSFEHGIDPRIIFFHGVSIDLHNIGPRLVILYKLILSTPSPIGCLQNYDCACGGVPLLILSLSISTTLCLYTKNQMDHTHSSGWAHTSCISSWVLRLYIWNWQILQSSLIGKDGHCCPAGWQIHYTLHIQLDHKPSYSLDHPSSYIHLEPITSAVAYEFRRWICFLSLKAHKLHTTLLTKASKVSSGCYGSCGYWAIVQYSWLTTFLSHSAHSLPIVFYFR